MITKVITNTAGEKQVVDFFSNRRLRPEIEAMVLGVSQMNKKKDSVEKKPQNINSEEKIPEAL